MALIVRAPWTSQPQLPTQGAPEFQAVTTLAAHNFTNSGTARGAKKSGVVHTSNGSSTYLSRSIAKGAGPPVFVAAYFRRTGNAAAGATLYALGENAATGSFIGLRAGASGGAGAISIFYRATASGVVFEVGSNTTTIIPLDTDTCVVGVLPSYASAEAYIYVNGVKYNQVLTVGTPSGNAALSFEAIGANRRDTVTAHYPSDTYAVGYGGAIAEERARFISLNPWSMFAPQQRRIWVPTSAAATAALTGTVTSATEANIVSGGRTIILTLTGDTWVTAGATFDGQRQNIIDGLTSAQSELLGWNSVVKASQGVGGVVRTSDTVVTITLDAQVTYNITANETITVTIPATALTGAVALVATPTFTITQGVAALISNILHGAAIAIKGYFA